MRSIRTRTTCYGRILFRVRQGASGRTCEPAVVGVGGQLPAGLGNPVRRAGHAGQEQAELVGQQLVAGHGVDAERRQRFHYRVVAVGQRRVRVVPRLVVVVLDVQARQFRVFDAQFAARRVYVLTVQRLQ